MMGFWQSTFVWLNFWAFVAFEYFTTGYDVQKDQGSICVAFTVAIAAGVICDKISDNGK